jgi:thioesterase domain-containing protein
VAATGESPSPKKVKPPRSHWDMLMERRTVEDLEAVLAERLEVIKERRSGGQDTGRPHRRSA